MESIQKILNQKKFLPSDEMGALKDYVKHNYDSPCRVREEKGVIILAVPNSGLAATLQMEKTQLIEECGVTKKLLIRIGS